MEAGEPGQFLVIAVSESQSITCYFGQNEGGDRFANQLLQEKDRANQSD